MTKAEWGRYLQSAREEAAAMPHRFNAIVIDLILTLGNVVFDHLGSRTHLISSEAAPGPCSPRDARDEVEGEAIAPTDHEYDYCPAVWRGNIPWKAHARLGCTRPVHTTGDHCVGHGGSIVARWPMTDDEISKCKTKGCDKQVAPGCAKWCLDHVAEGR